MKKQLMRYRLIADQKVGRANRSEVLNEELLQVEKHMEHVRAACLPTYKKLSQCMQSHGIGDYDKRLKRLSESVLAQAMTDASRTLVNENEPNQALGYAMKVCADAQNGLAKEKAIYEMFVDEHIISPLQNLVEVEIPSVLKQRERLKKLVLDRDGANQNYQKAYKAVSTPGINMQQASAKADALKDEYDQAVVRMEQCKDQLVTEMFEYLSKEIGHGQRMADFHAKQLDYHRRCVTLLEKLEPDINNLQEKTVINSCFGRPLAEHLRRTEREIASPLEACALCLIEYGLKQEGIFRIGGGAAKLRKSKALVDGGVLDLGAYDAQDDIHAVAGVLKQYLRDLPDPLLTHHLYDEWLASASVQDHDQKLQEIWKVIDKLPAENKANFRYLIKFCALVAESQDVNKMTASNLAVVLAPNLLWSTVDDMSTRMMTSNVVTNIIELVITYSDWFFPGDIDFVVTPHATSYTFNQPVVLETLPQQSAPPLSPTAPSKPVYSPSHSRNSSSDTTLSSDNVNQKPRKQKRAPPPPQTQPPGKTHERTKSSPPMMSGLSSAPANGTTAPVKPPIAAKRSSTKKPLQPPPQPPKASASGGDALPSDEKAVKPKPRTQHRKPTVNSIFENPPPSSSPVNANDPALANSHNREKPSHSPPQTGGAKLGTAFRKEPKTQFDDDCNTDDEGVHITPL